MHAYITLISMELFSQLLHTFSELLYCSLSFYSKCIFRSSSAVIIGCFTQKTMPFVFLSLCQRCTLFYCIWKYIQMDNNRDVQKCFAAVFSLCTIIWIHQYYTSSYWWCHSTMPIMFCPIHISFNLAFEFYISYSVKNFYLPYSLSEKGFWAGSAAWREGTTLVRVWQ